MLTSQCFSSPARIIYSEGPITCSGTVGDLHLSRWKGQPAKQGDRLQGSRLKWGGFLVNDGGELSNEWRGIFTPHGYLTLSSRFFRQSRVAFVYSLCMQRLFPKRIGDMIKWKRGSLGGFSETGRLRQQFRH